MGRSGRFPLIIVCGVLPLLLTPLSSAYGRPPADSGILPSLESLEFPGRATDLPPPGNPGLFGVAQSGTTWFGGTVWAADSMRWEAIEGQLWTFDTGVGSSIVPLGGPAGLSTPTREWINPYKQPGLHATMEGWIGFDKTYGRIPYFRRLASTDPRWDSICVGAPAGLGGTYSLWAGAFLSEAEALCYRNGQGYGNSWNICVEHPFTYIGGAVTLGFTYRIETEPDFDLSVVYVDSGGAGDLIEVASYTGSASGSADLSLIPGIELPIEVPKTITIRFCFASDGAWSDEDGLFPTVCGGFAVDDVSVTGGGISHVADFESSEEGWALVPAPPGYGEEWSSLYHLSDLPATLASCPCALTDSVLAFPDDSNKHSCWSNNLAVSPWVDLQAAGLVGAPGRILRTNLYVDLPLMNYVFAQFEAQWYPETCLHTGKLVTSPWTSNGFVYYFGNVPKCTTPDNTLGTQIDFSAVIPPGAEQVRMAVGVVNFSGIYLECYGSNSSPWFDLAGFGVYGLPGAPYIHAGVLDIPQDNFPQNGTVNINAPGRVDCNNVQGAEFAGIRTTLGDTLVIRGGHGNAEVYVHFRVVPGLGTHENRFNTWWNRHAESPWEPGFKMARCDSAEHGASGPISGAWMTAYHEADANFTGTDLDIDVLDRGPEGGTWRLANDIFPDDLFTMGTRIDIFYTANEVGSSTTFRDPPDPATYEMEILPAAAPNNDAWSCVLYVDHFNRGAQEYIDEALLGILGPGVSSGGRSWDRLDVNAEASGQMSFGRPLQTEYGASVIQALVYEVILWNSGNLGAFTLSQEDAAVLNPWLTLLDFDFNNLYLSGDGLVHGVLQTPGQAPSPRRLIEDISGVSLWPACSQGSFRVADCPYAGAPVDFTPCVNLVPVVDAVVAGSGAGRSVGHQGQGNGCPELRSFDVLTVLPPDFGVSRGDERYSTPVKGARFASVSTDAVPSGILNYKVVVDGVSVHYRRDASGPCDYAQGGSTAVAERIREVLEYFGHTSGDQCFEPELIGIEEGIAPTPAYRFSLSGPAPNPMVSGSPGKIRFTLTIEGRALLEVYDLQGRRVKTVFDGVAPAGENEAVWNGTDEPGSRVASGVYFLRFRAEGKELSSRVVVLRGGER